LRFGFEVLLSCYKRSFFGIRVYGDIFRKHQREPDATQRSDGWSGQMFILND